MRDLRAIAEGARSLTIVTRLFFPWRMQDCTNKRALDLIQLLKALPVLVCF